jgi:hypothetical protein
MSAQLERRTRASATKATRPSAGRDVCRHALLVIALSSGTLVACERQASTVAPKSTAQPRARGAAKPAPAKRWEQLERAASWPPLTEAPLVSQGHFDGRMGMQLLVSPEAREQYLKLSRNTLLPEDSVLIAKLFAVQSGEPFAMLGMHKRSGQWEFVLADGSGRIRERGSLALCTRCHAEGIGDHLFGLPRTNLQTTPADSPSGPTRHDANP